MPRTTHPSVKTKHSRAHVRQMRINKRSQRCRRLIDEHLVSDQPKGQPIDAAPAQPPTIRELRDGMRLFTGDRIGVIHHHGQLSERLSYREGWADDWPSDSTAESRAAQNRAWQAEAQEEAAAFLKPPYEYVTGEAFEPLADIAWPLGRRPHETDLWGAGDCVSYTGQVWASTPGERDRWEASWEQSHRLLAEVQFDDASDDLPAVYPALARCPYRNGQVEVHGDDALGGLLYEGEFALVEVLDRFADLPGPAHAPISGGLLETPPQLDRRVMGA